MNGLHDRPGWELEFAEIAGGSLYIGSPETVAQRIARAVHVLDVGRFDLIYTTGSLPASARRRAVELYGTAVIPRVRELLAETNVTVSVS